jgi:hypothetical protein
VWGDAAGTTTLTQPRGSGSMATLEGALEAASNAVVLLEWEGTENVTAFPTPVAAPYQSVADQATLNFQTAAGNIVRLTLPAPQSGIFLADQYTVDPTNPFVVTIIGAALAVLVDSSGNPVTAFIGGTRNG